MADLFEALAVEDIQNAADVLRPVYDALNGDDGFVSLEVSPYLAMDTKGTIAEAERLWKDVKRKNLMVKVPATPEGLPAIEHLIGEGISINITLLFSQAGLSRGRGGLYRRPGKIRRHGRRSLPCRQRRLVLRQPHRQRRRQAARREDRQGQRSRREGTAERAEGQGRHRQRQARLPGLQAPVLRRALGQARGQGRQAAAAAVGFHRHQEQGLQRRAVCRGADRPQHRQHRAAGNAGCVPRPWQAARQPRGEYRGRAPRAGRAGKIRHLARRHHGRTGQGRRQAVCRRRRQALRRGRAQARDLARRRHRPAATRTRRRHQEGRREKHRGMARFGDDPPAVAEGQIGLDR